MRGPLKPKLRFFPDVGVLPYGQRRVHVHIRGRWTLLDAFDVALTGWKAQSPAVLN